MTSRARTRNLAVSFAILALLAVSIVFTSSNARRAQRLARQQMEFVAAVSHELRTPLATIRTASDNLASGVIATPERVQEYGALLQSEGIRLSEMVEHVLEFARADATGTRELRLISVRDAIESAMRMSRFAIDRSAATVEVVIEENLPLVRGDVAGLARAVENLIGNAIKYSDGDPLVSIRASANDTNVTIEVEDRGRGIAPTDLPHIFEPFYRGAGIADAQIPGSGLGLAVVQRVVHAFGGEVDVLSALGRGSTFRITLPAVTR